MSSKIFYNLFLKKPTALRFYSNNAYLISGSNYVPSKLYSSPSPMLIHENNFLSVNNILDISVRYKSKDRGGNKKNANKGKVELNVNQLIEVINYEKLKADFEDSIKHYQEDMAQHLSLRTSAGSIETLPVTYNGKDYELQELAQVVRKNPKIIMLQMDAFPASIPKVIQAIQSSGLNLNPQQEGTNLYIPIPKVTKEHREHLAKNAKVLYIKCRDAIKQINLQFLKDLKKQEKLPEDLAYNIRKQIGNMTDDYLLKAKMMNDKKNAELLKE